MWITCHALFPPPRFGTLSKIQKGGEPMLPSLLSSLVGHILTRLNVCCAMQLSPSSQIVLFYKLITLIMLSCCPESNQKQAKKKSKLVLKVTACSKLCLSVTAESCSLASFIRLPISHRLCLSPMTVPGCSSLCRSVCFNLSTWLPI